MPEGATAFAQRDSITNMMTAVAWRHGVDDPAAHIPGDARYWATLEPFTRGFYVNDLAREATVKEIGSNYRGNYPRMVATKKKLRPDEPVPAERERAAAGRLKISGRRPLRHSFLATGGRAVQCGRGSTMQATESAPGKAVFTDEVIARFGVLPNFFCTAQAAPGLIEELWGFAKSAYLDSPLPSNFKERLFVYLSRFCEVRYCIVRHVGFLVGNGRPAGDASVPPHTVEQALELLRRPVPDAAGFEGCLARLERHSAPAEIPGSATPWKPIFSTRSR